MAMSSQGQPLRAPGGCSPYAVAASSAPLAPAAARHSARAAPASAGSPRTAHARPRRFRRLAADAAVWIGAAQRKEGVKRRAWSGWGRSRKGVGGRIGGEQGPCGGRAGWGLGGSWAGKNAARAQPGRPPRPTHAAPRPAGPPRTKLVCMSASVAPSASGVTVPSPARHFVSAKRRHASGGVVAQKACARGPGAGPGGPWEGARCVAEAGAEASERARGRPVAEALSGPQRRTNAKTVRSARCAAMWASRWRA
jgi:hypothetical protein